MTLKMIVTYISHLQLVTVNFDILLSPPTLHYIPISSVPGPAIS